MLEMLRKVFQKNVKKMLHPGRSVTNVTFLSSPSPHPLATNPQSRGLGWTLKSYGTPPHPPHQTSYQVDSKIKDMR